MMWMLFQMQCMRKTLFLPTTTVFITMVTQMMVPVTVLQLLTQYMGQTVITRTYCLLITMVFITKLAQTHPRQRVPVIQLLPLILMVLLQTLQMMDMEVHLQVLLIAMEHLLQIVIMKKTLYHNTTMEFIMMGGQAQRLQVVPAILRLQVILMVPPLQHSPIVTDLLLQIVITRRTYYPSITMVFITKVVQPHQMTMVPAIQLLLLIPMVLLLLIHMVLPVTHPPPVMLQLLLAMQGLLRRFQLQGQDLSLAVTKILRLTSCPSISSLRSTLV